MKRQEDIVFGRVLRRLRTERNMIQTILGERCGVTYQQIQKYETGANRVSISTLFALAGALGLSPSAVVAEVEAELREGEPSGTGRAGI